MRLLIVDDDILTVDVVRNGLPWQQLDISSVETAHSMSSAQKIIRQDTPELILCDIEMPGGSGIELLKWIREREYLCEFIFLTCHESFDFAASAIEYGAIGYITKPFTPEKTIPVITKAVSKISMKMQEQEHRRYSGYWVSNRASIRENFWMELVMRNRFPDDTALVSELTKRDIDLQIESLCRPVLVSATKSQLDAHQRSSFSFSISNMGAELLLENLEVKDYIRYENDTATCVLFLLTQTQDPAFVSSACGRLMEAVRSYLGYAVNCYIGDTAPLRSLYTERERLDELCRNTLVLEGQVIWAFSAVQAGKSAIHSLNGEQYSEWLLQGDQLSIVNHLKQEFAVLTATSGLTKNALECVYQDFLQIVHYVLGQNGIQAHLLLDESSATALGRHAGDSVFDFMKWANYLTGRSIAVLKQTRSANTVVRSAQRYIEEHYSEDISRGDIAASVFLTADHFSRLFYAETGEHINDYINRIRVQKAKEILMRDPCIKIGELAIQTGFGSVSYFSTVFRKVTGQAPNEYRKRIQ